MNYYVAMLCPTPVLIQTSKYEITHPSIHPSVPSVFFSFRGGLAINHSFHSKSHHFIRNLIITLISSFLPSRCSIQTPPLPHRLPNLTQPNQPTKHTGKNLYLGIPCVKNHLTSPYLILLPPHSFLSHLFSSK